MGGALETGIEACRPMAVLLDPAMDAEVLAFAPPWNEAVARTPALTGVKPDASTDARGSARRRRRRAGSGDSDVWESSGK